MKRGVVDASAVIAFVRRERGFETVQEWLPGAKLSAVNFAEVLQKLVSNDQERLFLHGVIASFGIRVIDLDWSMAEHVARIYPNASKGVSMADRSCLALGIQSGLPVITGDHMWKQLDVGVEVIVFRRQNS